MSCERRFRFIWAVPEHVVQIPVITSTGRILLEANQTGAVPTDKAVSQLRRYGRQAGGILATVPLLLRLQSIRG